MKDAEGIQFLQWSLPKLDLQWRGFRKVRRQVYRRLNRRLKELGIPDVEAYRCYLDAHADEWLVLAGLCRITISRFYRDKAVFQFLEQDGLATLAQHVLARGERTVRCWSIGCASGEEPHTLAIIWILGCARRFPLLSIEILGTDIDPDVIARAQQACYPSGSLRDLPKSWMEQVFDLSDKGEYRLKEEFGKPVRFLMQDIRTEVPHSSFDMILCRYLAFTYFDEDSQRETIQKIRERLVPGGMLVLGSTENLPRGESGFEPWDGKVNIFRKV